MKKIYGFAALFMVPFILVGCGDANTAGNRLETQNAVEKVLAEAVEKEQNQDQSEPDKAKETEQSSLSGGTEEKDESIQETNRSGQQAYETVDIDLTAMSSDMVYATVYQLMITPEVYVGKTIKMKGSYYASWYEPTEKYYHYVLIADAAACCSQGIEFIWGDGEHVFPDEYPDYFAEVEVVGTFITYTEPDDPNIYCALDDAAMKLAAF